MVADQRPRAPADEGADLAIRMGAQPRRGVPSEPLMDESLYPVLAPAAWADADRAVDIEALARQLGLLHDRDPLAAWARWREARGPRTLDVRHGSRLTSSDLVLGAAERVSRGRARAPVGWPWRRSTPGGLVRPLGDAVIDLPDAYWLVGEIGGGVREAVDLCADWVRESARE